MKLKKGRRKWTRETPEKRTAEEGEESDRVTKETQEVDQNRTNREREGTNGKRDMKEQAGTPTLALRKKKQCRASLCG